MSSLARRACYKCGNVGHYAGQQDSIAAPITTSLTLHQRCALRPNAFATIVSTLVPSYLVLNQIADRAPRQTTWWVENPTI